ncbi:MAG: aminopeptidase P family protein [Candidatus Caldatribacterium sp.]|nr:aminopeptidase P family protein [Candidatus Caldatribacterium sp.]
MAYYDDQEMGKRVEKVREILERHALDFVLIYYDEFNLANAWYLTAWCPQFESGAVLVPREGSPMILGGPESEPFAKMDSAIKETRNLPVFMVPGEEYPNATIIDLPTLFEEVGRGKRIQRVGIVGLEQMPVSLYRQIVESFRGVELVDVTEAYTRLRYVKSPWEREAMRHAFRLARIGYKAMVRKIQPGVPEYEVAAAGEETVRSRGANGFGFRTIVASGARSNAVVPTASDKIMQAGEMVMVGLSPRWKGYCGCIGSTLPVDGEFTKEQRECIKHLQEAMLLAREGLKPGKTGKEIDAPVRAYFERIGYSRYLVCPFVHSIGLSEAEQPFFGPHSTDVLEPGMTVCIDVSFFGHPDFHGARLETGYEITESGAVPFDEETERMLLEGV